MRPTRTRAVAALVGACALATPGAAQPPAEPASFDVVAIADPREALTFARAVVDGEPRILAVTRYQADGVHGVDLSRLLARPAADPIDLVRTYGYDALLDAIVGAPATTRVSVAARSLIAPVDLRDRHIAAGLNYPEHAGESGVTEGPFLFAKLVAPTPPTAPVPTAPGVLLDYEVELGWVAMEPLDPTRPPRELGLVLCNDYTDRASLLRHADPFDVTSGKGFTTGKSFPGALPVGNLFVVPRDPRAFVRSLELRLYVNGRLRQQSPANASIWDVEALLREAWSRRHLSWEHQGARVSLPIEAGHVPDRTLLMMGTPEGTIFQGIAPGQYVRGAGTWLLGGWGTSLPRHVVETYVRDALASRAYLQPGDRVVIHVDRLGVIDTRVEGP